MVDTQVVMHVSDDEEDAYDELEHEVELGFVSKVEDVESLWRKCHRNPRWSEWDGGKVGGRPVWLNPETIPTADQLQCHECHEPLSFLVQIYCPLDEFDEAFHRTLYVFCCRNTSCTAVGSGRIFRCQLPRKNAYYAFDSSQPLEEMGKEPVKLCSLCGQRASFMCSSCHLAQYCCREHQKDHWKHGHKADCEKCIEQQQVVDSETSKQELAQKGSKWVFPEYEIVIEHEPDSGTAVNEHEARLIADFEKAKADAAASKQSGDSDPFSDDSEIDITQKELHEVLGATSAEQDKQYISFLTRIALAKDQVLRYARWDDDCILWTHSAEIKLADEVPCCERCGAPRKFEFQLLPQLLFFLQVDNKSSLTNITEKSCEWGTLVAYTCSANCDLQEAYATEYLYRQSPYAEDTNRRLRCKNKH